MKDKFYSSEVIRTLIPVTGRSFMKSFVQANCSKLSTLKTTLLFLGSILFLNVQILSFAQHDRERNAFRFLAEGNVKKAYSELKNGKKHTDPAEKAFVSTLCLLKEGKTRAAFEMAQKAVELGLPFERFLTEPREWLAPLRKLSAFKKWKSQRQPSLLIHGPMIGQVTDNSASFWFRTDGVCEIGVEITGHSGREKMVTTENNGFVGVIEVDGLLPGTYFAYEVFVNGNKFVDENREFGFRTFPQVDEGARFSIAFGGCSGFVPEYESVWERIADHDPRAMLMLGDNVYIDDPEDVKWTGDYCYSRRHSRPEWKKLVGKTSMHAIYDDHDFGMDDCVPGARVDHPAWKKPVLENFINNWNNPSVGGGDKNPGCWQTFSLGQVQFIMLDCRYYRDRKEKSMLGTYQKQWLKNTLRNSQATFKVIASSVPFSEGIKPGSKDPWDGYPEEREEVFRFLEEEKIEGVLLISADRHRIDVRKTARPRGYDLYEFVSGRITNRHVHPVVKTEGLIWGYNDSCGYCLLHFDTTKKNPVMNFEAYDNLGKLLFSQKVFSNDLKFKQ